MNEDGMTFRAAIEFIETIFGPSEFTALPLKGKELELISRSKVKAFIVSLSGLDSGLGEKITAGIAPIDDPSNNMYEIFYYHEEKQNEINI